MTQVEIPIPPQPRRVSLGQARAMRDLLEKELAQERPNLATEVTAIALQFNGAYGIFRRVRPSFYRKRKLDRLRDMACLIHALEGKGWA